MKKIFLFCLLFIFMININAEDLGLAKNSESAILIEASTNKILFEKDSHKKMAPASMTKMMTLLITMEELEKGNLKLDEFVTVSKRAQDMGGTQIYIEAGSKVKIEDLIKGVGIASANDAAVALAERIGGTVENFVNIMNQKSKELGCKNTNFKNPHGLDEENHYSSAYDMALIASELIKHEYALKISSTYDEYINISGEKHWLVNTNKLIKFYKGIDGLKTGYTDKAGYCLTATMNRNDMRLISVVMKSDTKDNRSSDTIGMMEYGYSMFGSESIIKKKDYSGNITINNSDKRNYSYHLDKDVNIIVNKNVKDITYKIDTKIYEVKAPLNKNDIVGKLILKYDNKNYEYNLLIDENVNKANVFKIFTNTFRDIVTGNIRK